MPCPVRWEQPRITFQTSDVAIDDEKVPGHSERIDRVNLSQPQSNPLFMPGLYGLSMQERITSSIVRAFRFVDPQPLDDSTSRRLSSQRRSDTRPETLLRKELWSRGFRYSLHRPIPGTRRTIDIALVRYEVAVFVDGCFWHGCPKHGSIPSNNAEWWARKFGANRRRDADTNRRLRSEGWTVVRVWEHESVCAAANKVQRAVERKEGR